MDKVVAGSLAACGVVLAGVVGLIVMDAVDEANEPSAGVVISTEYQPEVTVMSCTTVGKSVVCTPITSPECYEIRYTAPDGSTGDACVDPQTFREYAVGDGFPKEN